MIALSIMYDLASVLQPAAASPCLQDASWKVTSYSVYEPELVRHITS